MSIFRTATTEPQIADLPDLDVEGTEAFGIFIPTDEVAARIAQEDRIDAVRHVTRGRRLCR